MRGQDISELEAGQGLEGHGTRKGSGVGWAGQPAQHAEFSLVAGGVDRDPPRRGGPPSAELRGGQSADGNLCVFADALSGLLTGRTDHVGDVDVSTTSGAAGSPQPVSLRVVDRGCFGAYAEAGGNSDVISVCLQDKGLAYPWVRKTRATAEPVLLATGTRGGPTPPDFLLGATRA